MSKYQEQTTQFKNKKLLVEALQALGLTVTVHETAQHLNGYTGDTRQETAEVVILRQHIGSLSNDMGFKQQPDGTYKAIISDYDSRRFDAKWMKTLTAIYAKAGILLKAKQAGLKVIGEKVVNGKRQFQFITN